MKTLVLDKQYQPLTFISFRKLSIFYIKDKVDIISVWDDVVFLPNQFYPAIVRLHNYVKTRPIVPKFNRKAIFRRDEFKCQYTGKRYSASKLTIDHVIPRSKGGKNTWDNCVAAYFEINTFKGDRSPEEAGLKLLRKPGLPPQSVILEYKSMKTKHPDWLMYLESAGL